MALTPPPTQASDSGARTAGWLAAAIVAAAALLRAQDIDKLLPQIGEPDPGLAVQVWLHRDGIEPDAVDHKAYLAYPTLLARLLALLPREFATPEHPTLAGELARASADVLHTRWMVAFFAVLGVYATWRLAKRVLATPGALTATALVALNALHLVYSQQARPHVPHATVALLAVLAQMRFVRAPTTASFALAALASCGALAVLHTGVFTLPSLAVAWLLARRAGRAPPLWTALAMLAPLLGAVWTLYPRPPQLENAGATIEYGGHTLHFDKLDFSGFGASARALANYDPGLAALVMLGLVALVSARLSRVDASGGSSSREELLVLCGYAVPHVLVIGVYGETVDRFLLPLVPYFALLGGLAVQFALSWTSSLAGALSTAMRVAIPAAALAFPAWIAWRYAEVRAAPDTFEQAASWVEEHATTAADRVLLTPRMSLPLVMDDESLEFSRGDLATRRRPWIGHQLERLDRGEPPIEHASRYAIFAAPGAPPKLLHLQGEAAQRAVNELFDFVRPRYVLVENSRLMANFPGHVALREAAAARGELVVTLRGEALDECRSAPLDYQEIPRFCPRIADATAFGPCIEVYSIR